MAAVVGDEKDLRQSLLHLKLAIRAKEPPSIILLLARASGGGYITPEVQHVILAECDDSNVHNNHPQNYLYMRTILKKVIVDVESSSTIALEELYEKFGYFMKFYVVESQLYEDQKICKEISYLTFCSNECMESISFVARVQSSTNMLEGDTGCSLWPSSLFLSEFILTNPKLFFNKSCLEIGSGVGLVGIALKHVGASKVVLTDGDFLALENMKMNMHMNGLIIEPVSSQKSSGVNCTVECKYLSWEHVQEGEFLENRPKIILGADIVYDPHSIPHLIKLLAALLRPEEANPVESHMDHNGVANDQAEAPIAYIATIIRNRSTFDCFRNLAEGANLSVVDITDATGTSGMLPYMLSYERSSVHLFEMSQAQ